MSCRNPTGVVLRVVAVLALVAATGMVLRSGGPGALPAAGTVAPRVGVPVRPAATAVGSSLAGLPHGAYPVVHTDQSMSVGGLTRSWVAYTGRGAPVTRTTPILVVLAGHYEAPALEAARDGLLPLAAAGRAELVYPLGVGLSWNAGGCCGPAAAQHVDDVGFIEALVARVDPGGARPVDLVGYSNGGRLAYRMACEDPRLFAAYAVIAAVPVTPCAAPRPVSLVQVAGTADTVVPYARGDPGIESPPVTVQVARVRALDRCPHPAAVLQVGTLTQQAWSGCRDGTRLTFATYHGQSHLWPAGDATTPGAAVVIWDFLARR